MKLDLVIHNAVIVTVNPNFDIIQNGVIGIRNGLIECVLAGGKDVLSTPAMEYIDAGGGIVMPGLVNAHTHLPMSLFRGLADDLPLSEWLNDHIFPAESRHITPETARTGALLSCLEMLLSGTTTCCDGYFCEDAVAEAIAFSGIRAVAAQGVIDYPAPGVPDPSRNVETAVAFVEKWRDRSPLITPSIFCHSPYTCSSKTLQKAKQAADRLGVLFQIHVAETKFEREQSLAATNMTPVAYLDSLGVLDENTLAVHAVWVDEGDRIGSLEPGKQADIIIINTHQPHLTPVYHSESHLAYAVRGADVRDVLVAGRVVVRNRRPVALDMEDVQDRAVAFSILT